MVASDLASDVKNRRMEGTHKVSFFQQHNKLISSILSSPIIFRCSKRIRVSEFRLIGVATFSMRPLTSALSLNVEKTDNSLFKQ